MYYSGRLDAAAIDWCLALEYVLHHKVTCIARPCRYHAAPRHTFPNRAASRGLAPCQAASYEDEVGANGTASATKA